MKAAITYNGEAASYRIKGITFKPGKTVDVTDQDVVDLASTTSGFTVRLPEPVVAPKPEYKEQEKKGPTIEKKSFGKKSYSPRGRPSGKKKTQLGE
jgi:hypothetical protein